jgi:hypothetical protein
MTRRIVVAVLAVPLGSARPPSARQTTFSATRESVRADVLVTDRVRRLTVKSRVGYQAGA